MKRLEAMFSGTGKDAREICRTLQSVMWDLGGVIRNDRGLKDALSRIEELRSLGRRCRAENAVQLTRRLDLENMLLVSEMVCRAALCRSESRGAHHRTDCPQEKNPEWLRNVHIRKGQGETMIIETVPVSQ